MLALATRLRGDGFNVIIDKDEPFPAKGWPEWMRKQIASAQFVLVVCTEKYRRRAEGDEEPGKAWERRSKEPSSIWIFTKRVAKIENSFRF